jgi:hypothetical protein
MISMKKNYSTAAALRTIKQNPADLLLMGHEWKNGCFTRG